jgi:hypothetical protein
LQCVWNRYTKLYVQTDPLKYGEILDLTDLRWRILSKSMALIPLLSSGSLRKERLSVPSVLMLTGLKSLWWIISNNIAASIYSFEFIFVQELYKACSFERGSENSFERMRCIPNGFCINGRGYIVNHHGA